MKILIVEDEAGLRESMVSFLEEEKYIVETAGTYKEAIDKILVYDYSCILLDITLPDGSGLEILTEIKENRKEDSVIIISAKDALDDKLKGLSIGADDYLTKPFHLAELNARIKAVLRRKSFDGHNIVVLNNISVNFDDRVVTIDGAMINLNRKEYDLFLYLVANKNRLVTKTALVEHVWGDKTEEADNFDFIYSQIKHLRKKMATHGADMEIQAIYGIGYKLSV